MYHTGKCLLSELSDDGRLFYLKDTKQIQGKNLHDEAILKTCLDISLDTTGRQVL